MTRKRIDFPADHKFRKYPKIHKLTEHELFDYISCPIYYDLKYNSKLNFKPIPTMNRLLNQVVNGFAANMMNDRILSPYHLKVQWDGICGRNQNYITEAKAIEGLKQINQFYSWASNTQLNIVDIGGKYILRQVLNNENILEYEGYLDIIAVPAQKKALELLRVSFSNKPPEQAILDLDLKIGLDHAGFNNIYKHPLLGCRVHHIKSNKDFYTTRDTPTETKRALATIKNVYLCIRNKLFYPRQNPLCVSCQAKDFCRAWQEQKIEKQEESSC